ncbi:MAG: hypothetical protein ACI83B_000176 [Sediminicola sp.]|jgi:hypothetical protein|tara:strand:+ start:7224 stop:8246 length:1023 start_codon:yes stop_codon:yes gene_type:complete
MKKIFRILVILQLTLFVSCTDEGIGDMDINEDVVDEELFQLIERVSSAGDDAIECIKFNYSFPIFIFDENLEYVDVALMTDDVQFSDFLVNLPEDYSISLSYPIAATLSNGDLIDINSNQELALYIDACTEEAYQRRCNRALTSCVWDVSALESFPNDFEGDYFYLNNFGIIQFHSGTEIYFGTWTTFYIEDDLHLNMYINRDGEIANTWNYDWKVVVYADDRIELETADNRVLIEKNCAIDCADESFQECEIEIGSGFAEFSFENYSFCIPISPTHDLVSAVSFSYYETEEDAIEGINAISSTEYTNTANPQTIFVRIEYVESGELLGFWEISIEAIQC